MQILHRLKYKYEFRVKNVQEENGGGIFYYYKYVYKLDEPIKEQNELDDKIYEDEQGKSGFSFDSVLKKQRFFSDTMI